MLVLTATIENDAETTFAGSLTTPNGGRWPARFGRAGVTAAKKEGDGASPLGDFRLRSCYWRPDRGPRPLTALPTIAITRDLGWCDDPAHPLYNRPVRLGSGRLSFGPSHERMWRDDRAYDLVVVLDQNMDPAVPGKGSAVFWHLTKTDDEPGYTEGCVAIAPAPMRELLAACDTRTIMRIAG